MRKTGWLALCILLLSAALFAGGSRENGFTYREASEYSPGTVVRLVAHDEFVGLAISRGVSDIFVLYRGRDTVGQENEFFFLDDGTVYVIDGMNYPDLSRMRAGIRKGYRDGREYDLALELGITGIDELRALADQPVFTREDRAALILMPALREKIPSTFIPMPKIIPAEIFESTVRKVLASFLIDLNPFRFRGSSLADRLRAVFGLPAQSTIRGESGTRTGAASGTVRGLTSPAETGKTPGSGAADGGSNVDSQLSPLLVRRYQIEELSESEEFSRYCETLYRREDGVYRLVSTAVGSGTDEENPDLIAGYLPESFKKGVREGEIPALYLYHFAAAAAGSIGPSPDVLAEAQRLAEIQRGAAGGFRTLSEYRAAAAAGFDTSGEYGAAVAAGYSDAASFREGKRLGLRNAEEYGKFLELDALYRAVQKKKNLATLFDAMFFHFLSTLEPGKPYSYAVILARWNDYIKYDFDIMKKVGAMDRVTIPFITAYMEKYRQPLESIGTADRDGQVFTRK